MRTIPAVDGCRARLLARELHQPALQRVGGLVVPGQIVHADEASRVNHAAHLAQGRGLVQQAKGALAQGDVECTFGERQGMGVPPAEHDVAAQVCDSGACTRQQAIRLVEAAYPRAEGLGQMTGRLPRAAGNVEHPCPAGRAAKGRELLGQREAARMQAVQVDESGFNQIFQ